jgi:hypothetical protein
VIAAVSDVSTAAEALRKDAVILKYGRACAAEITALVSPPELDPEKPLHAAGSALWSKTRALVREHAAHELALSDVGGCLLCVPAKSTDGRARGVMQVICSRSGARLDEQEVAAITRLSLHTGEALANVALRDTPLRSVLLGVLHKDYPSCIAGIVSQVKSCIGCAHVEVLPVKSTVTGPRPVAYRLPAAVSACCCKRCKCLLL